MVYEKMYIDNDEDSATSKSSIKDLFWNLERPSTKWSGYFDVYERHLSKFVGKAPRILEIGVLGGGSIEMWLKYFGAGTSVVGVDINEECLKYEFDGNAKIVMGNQGDPAFWDEFLSTQDKFDIVIDDGSHVMNHQITTLNKVFPHVKEGGVFICEDTHTSYWPQPWGGVFRGAGTFTEHSKRVTDILNKQHFQGSPIDESVLNTYHNLYSVAFYNSMVVMEKEKLKLFAITDNSANVGRDL
jgi:SAM-dependent methyltransferase